MYLVLFVTMAVTAAVAFKLWSIKEARRRIERRARRAEPILTEGTPRRPSIRSRPF
jgi:Flp pilus assembly protein TadB